MKLPSRSVAGFSLVEVTLALGIAAFCLIAVLGALPVSLKTQQAGGNQTKANQIVAAIFSDLRADVRLPPGQASKAQGEWSNLHGHWAQVATPDVLYFTNDTKQTGSTNQGTAPSDAVFRATITYMLPPTPGYTTSVADIKVTWPARVDPATGVPAGKAETFIAVNR
jgi:type II secretory pathway component PulJ